MLSKSPQPKAAILVGKLSLVLILSNVARGAGFYLPNQDAFATSRGNAFVATADSPAAVFYNPAGMSQLETSELSLGFYAIQLGNTANISDTDFRAQTEWQFVPHLYYVQPIDNRWHWGLGLNSQFGLGTDWGDNTPFRSLGTEALIQTGSLSSVFSYKISNSLSLGAGISINYMNAELRQGLLQPTDEFAFEGDDLSIGWSFGALWKPHEQHSFGLSYRSKNRYQLSGETELDVGNGLPSSFEDATLSLLTPEVISFGYSFRPTPQWNLEINIDRIGWDDLQTSQLSQQSGDIFIPYNWQSSYIYSLGASYTFKDNYTISVGYNYNANSNPDSTFQPLVSDANRHWINAGIRKTYDHWDWAIAYQYGFSERQVSDATFTPSNGVYESNHHALIFTLGYKF